jgi:hypothetical protein
VKDGHLKAGHDKPFYNIRTFKPNTKSYSAFPHMSDHTEIKKNYRDEEGAVKVAPKNPVVSMGKKAKSFAAFPEHIGCSYDNAKLLRRKEQYAHKALEQEHNFSQRVKLQDAFNPIMKVYGEDVPLPHKPVIKQVYKGAEHERAFRPSMPPRSGWNCTLIKHPEFMPNPPK